MWSFHKSQSALLLRGCFNIAANGVYKSPGDEQRYTPVNSPTLSAAHT